MSPSVSGPGLMPLSPLAALKTDEWDRIIDVNIGGVLNGVAAALPRFQAQGEGHFVNLASVAARQVWPTTAVYSATKFVVRAITEGLRACALQTFPYLVFYVEREDDIDVWRVLHGNRDIPAWLLEPEI